MQLSALVAEEASLPKGKGVCPSKHAPSLTMQALGWIQLLHVERAFQV